MRRRRSPLAPRLPTSSGRSSCGTTRSSSAGREDRGDRLWQAAELASATAGNERAVEVAQEAFQVGPPPQGEAFGHERLGRYLWASGHLEESRDEFEKARALLGDDGDPKAAGVFAGLGQAELMAGHYELSEQWCARVFELVEKPADDPPGMGDGAAHARPRPEPRRPPRGRSRAVPRGPGGGPDSTGPSARGDLLLPRRSSTMDATWRR